MNPRSILVLAPVVACTTPALPLAGPPASPSASPPVASSAPSASLAPVPVGALGQGWQAFSPPMMSKVTIAEFSVSSSYPGYPTSYLSDRDVNTSWFSDRGDSASKGKSPFVHAALERPSRVGRVVVLGNRHPSFPQGYSVLTARVVLVGENDQTLRQVERRGEGGTRDFDVRFEPPVEGVIAVLFLPLTDEGNQNPYGDVAVAEMWLE